MSDNMIFTQDASGTRFAPSSAKKAGKGLKWLLIFVALVLVGEFIWFFGIRACIPLSTVDIRSFSGFSRVDVLRYANISESDSFFSVNAMEVQRQLSGHYMVESAKVIKRFPDKISIFLEPRSAAIISLADIGGRQLPLYFDKHGVLIEIGDSGSEIHSGLPILSGLVFERPAPGMRLPAIFVPLLGEFSMIAANSPELLSTISEVRINRKAFDGFDLVLYPLHGSIRVQLGNSITEDTLRYVLLILDVFKSHPVKPEEIDFRSGMGSYKIKEAPSGE